MSLGLGLGLEIVGMLPGGSGNPDTWTNPESGLPWTNAETGDPITNPE